MRNRVKKENLEGFFLYQEKRFWLMCLSHASLIGAIILIGALGVITTELGLDSNPYKTKYDKIFLRRLSPIIFLSKTLKLNKIVMKCFANLSFGVEIKL